MAGAVAAVTSRAKVGTWVLSALHRNPGIIAKTAETLDEISGGRFVFGLGAGHEWPGQARAFGLPEDADLRPVRGGARDHRPAHPRGPRRLRGHVPRGSRPAAGAARAAAGRDAAACSAATDRRASAWPSATPTSTAATSRSAPRSRRSRRGIASLEAICAELGSRSGVDRAVGRRVGPAARAGRRPAQLALGFRRGDRGRRALVPRRRLHAGRADVPPGHDGGPRGAGAGRRGDPRGLSPRAIIEPVVDQARVVVIGGGITGVSVAYHLAEAGWTDVLLVEKAGLTAGATSQAAGLVTAFNPSSTMLAWRRYSIELYGRLGVFSAVGSVRLASSPEQLKELERTASRARGVGLDVGVISAEEARRLLPGDLAGVAVRRGVPAGRRLPRPAHGDVRPRRRGAEARRPDPAEHAGDRVRARATARDSPRARRGRRRHRHGARRERRGAVGAARRRDGRRVHPVDAGRPSARRPEGRPRPRAAERHAVPSATPTTSSTARPSTAGCCSAATRPSRTRAGSSGVPWEHAATSWRPTGTASSRSWRARSGASRSSPTRRPCASSAIPTR